MYTDAQLRSHIYNLQRFLRRIMQEQNYLQPLVPDGIFGPETAAAVRDFQRQNNLPVTGIADFDTWTRIYARFLPLSQRDLLPSSVSFFPADVNAHLSPDDKGAPVFALQLMLNTAVPHFAGLSLLSLTGEYDRATEQAVRNVQAAFGLPPTGVTDRLTWETLALFHNSYFGLVPLSWTLAETQ